MHKECYSCIHTYTYIYLHMHKECYSSILICTKSVTPVYIHILTYTYTCTNNVTPVYLHMHKECYSIYIHILTYTYTCTEHQHQYTIMWLHSLRKERTWTKTVTPDAKHQHQYTIMWLQSLRKECTWTKTVTPCVKHQHQYALISKSGWGCYDDGCCLVFVTVQLANLLHAPKYLHAIADSLVICL